MRGLTRALSHILRTTFVLGITLALSHTRMVLTRTSESIPVSASRMLLGTWQGLFLFEHRRDTHRREVIVAVSGRD